MIIAHVLNRAVQTMQNVCYNHRNNVRDGAAFLLSANLPMRTVAETAKAYITPDGPPAPAPVAPFVAETVAVNIALLRATHSADYHYARGARALTTYLRLVPPPTRGYQRLLCDELRIAPAPHSVPRFTDEWGTTLIEIHQERVESHQTLVAATLVETVGCYDAVGAAVPTPMALFVPVARPAGDYLSPTPLTDPDDLLRDDAHQIGRQTDGTPPLARLMAFAGFVHSRMRFQSGTTGVRTKAMEAWQNKIGVCQDYTHILLALCRLNGIPARYVSGCVPGEGVMHAWAEACLPHPTDPALLCWWPVDPTYNKWVGERYLSVAAGRDYHDIAPTYGTYYGGANTLRHRSQIVIEQKATRLLARAGKNNP